MTRQMSEEQFVVKAAYMANWPLNDIELWRRIAAHSFEDPGHSQTFAARLARDHGWTLDFARRAIEEYRRFCFLALTGNGQATPSEEVDEVWHQHLTYSRDYWDEWCGKVLGRPLHHQPTRGGASEGSRFAEQYAETLAHYEERFGPPDPMFWPGIAERFGGPRFQVVDLDRTLTLPVPKTIARFARRLGRRFGAFAVGAGLLAPKPVAAADLGPLDWQGGDFLKLYAGLMVAALILSVGYRLVLKRVWDGAIARNRKAGPVELALLTGGRQRATDVLALELMRGGHIRVTGNEVEVLDRPHLAGASHADILRRYGRHFSRSRVGDILEPSVLPVWERLARDGLALSPGQVLSIRVAAFALFGSVALFGLAKVAIGLSRGKPVGFLLAMIVVTVVASLFCAAIGKLGTGAGARLVADFRRDNERAMRAPRSAEITTAFAILGASALIGTSLAPYSGVIPKSDGGSGCGGGGSGDGGGDGGGCGGCGGGGGD